LVSSKDGKGDVYKMDIEPFSPTEIARDDSHDLTSPVYSPDGTRLAYTAVTESKTGELHLMDVRSNSDKVLLSSEVGDLYPKFSPDGGSIVFQNRVNGNAEICVMSIDGGDVRNLTQNPARDIHPSWSPDGSKIVFVSNREGNYDVFPIYVMNSDGSNPHRIYYTYAVSLSPVWSPDAQQIVFANDKEDSRTGNFELFTIEPETVNPEKRLTFRKKYDSEPAFSPDGRRIAFSSNADGNWEVYVMNSDGSSLLRITRDLATDLNPSWSPDGKRIIFSSNRNGKFAVFEAAID
jgi:Tol biopolymer transport system component